MKKSDATRKKYPLKWRKMYAVNYFDDNEEYHEEGEGTFEIFPTLKEAKKFYEKEDGKALWVALFNPFHIFKEEGAWNYEDYADLYQNKKILMEEV